MSGACAVVWSLMLGISLGFGVWSFSP
jgi:hypothetical protein